MGDRVERDPSILLQELLQGQQQMNQQLHQQGRQMIQG